MKVLALIVFIFAPVFAQMPVFTFAPELTKYLDLSATQLLQIGSTQADFATFRSSRLQRMTQVQTEVAIETQKSPLDPMALGVRYAELETIRRELATESDAVATRMRNLMNDAQKAKLKVLEEAAKLQLLIVQAQCYGLITTAANQWFDTSGTLVPSMIVSVPPGSSPSCGYVPFLYGSIGTTGTEARRAQ